MKYLTHSSHSIMIDKELCTGCVVCTLACPVQAIRVRDGKAEVNKSELCIDCGECLRVCPEQAVKSMTLHAEDLTGYKVLVALPSPALYAQFGDLYTPNDILLALRKIGFHKVCDLALNCEMVLIAIGEYLRSHTAVRPMLSNFCPAVTRLILKNYPKLIDHIIPIETPREIAADQMRRKIMRERGIESGEIGVFHITPCPAKMISITDPVGVEKSNLDGAIAIRDLYVRLRKALKEIEDDWILQKSSGVGISWATGQASMRGLPSMTSLSVTGVGDVIQILDDVEAEHLGDVDYLELSICPGGCVGGPLVVQNKHVAASHIANLVEQYGVRSRVDPRKIERQLEQTYLLDQKKFLPQEPEPLDTDLTRALEKMAKIEEYRSLLPGRQCGACGAPSCEALAEDIVKGEAHLSDCIFERIKELEHALEGDRGGVESGDPE